MYTPEINSMTEKDEIVQFMKQFSFATIITAKDSIPVGTHLPFLISDKDGVIILSSHFARANVQWQEVENNKVLVIFSGPNAYISPKLYDKKQNVPTWNYIIVHAYGRGTIITESDKVFNLLNATIDNYEISFRDQWDSLPEDYKLKLSKGIVAFEITVSDLQAKKKLSQDKSDSEQLKIIDFLSKRKNTQENLIAEYMKKKKI